MPATCLRSTSHTRVLFVAFYQEVMRKAIDKRLGKQALSLVRALRERKAKQEHVEAALDRMLGKEEVDEARQSALEFHVEFAARNRKPVDWGKPESVASACKVCLSFEADFLYTCGHKSTCSACYLDTCPVCDDEECDCGGEECPDCK
jgi:hypothetical protein